VKLYIFMSIVLCYLSAAYRLGMKVSYVSEWDFNGCSMVRVFFLCKYIIRYPVWLKGRQAGISKVSTGSYIVA
jgi:hypothetical protein